MKPTVERLSQQFTQLIGPEAFAKAEAAIAAAKAAAEAAAKAAAEKAAAAAAAAKAAAEAAAKAAAAAPAPAAPAAGATPAAATTAPAASGARPPSAAAAPVSTAPATATPTPKPVVAAASAAPAAAPRPTVATAPRPAVAGTAAPAARPVPAAAPAPAPAPTPTLPLQTVEHAAKGYDLDATVASSQVIAAAQLLDREGFALDTITGVDWIAQNEMEVVYDYFHPTDATRVVVRARVPRATPELPSITSVFPGANWHERETHDFFGIRFAGHPNLKPFLLPEDADFHPLRKDYK